MWFSDVANVENPGLAELQGFVAATMTFLELVMESGEFRFLWGNDQDLLRLANETFRTDVRRSAGELIEVIPKIQQSGLQNHGLVGRPMRFKLRVIDSLGNRWDRVRRQFSVRKWFRDMIEAIDIVIDSLIAAAGGVGGVLKEFKDALLSLAKTKR